jgi:hypothetical protein
VLVKEILKQEREEDKNGEWGCKENNCSTY